jgi:hypothetical protein
VRSYHGLWFRLTCSGVDAAAEGTMWLSLSHARLGQFSSHLITERRARKHLGASALQPGTGGLRVIVRCGRDLLVNVHPRASRCRSLTGGETDAGHETGYLGALLQYLNPREGSMIVLCVNVTPKTFDRSDTGDYYTMLTRANLWWQTGIATSVTR